MKFTELVPQVFFDAIARIASGLILHASIAVIWNPELLFIYKKVVEGFKAAPTTVSIAALVVAYVTAFCFEGFRDVIKIPKRILNRNRKSSGKERRRYEWEEAWQDFSKVYPNESTLKPQRPSDAVAIDVLRIAKPVVGSRIVKLRAEVSLCKTLSTGWKILSLILFLQLIVCIAIPDLTSRNIISLIIPILLTAVGALIIEKRQLSLDNRHLRALYNHWLLLIDPGVPGLTNRKGVSSQNQKGNPPALLISKETVREDTELNEGPEGERKLVVQDIYPSVEMLATGCRWKVPNLGEKCQVLKLSNVEVGIFSNIASQVRHYHKIGTEIYSVIDGEMDIVVNDEVFTLRSGDMIVVSPNSVHEVQKSNRRFLCQVISANCQGKEDKYVV